MASKSFTCLALTIVALSCGGGGSGYGGQSGSGTVGGSSGQTGSATSGGGGGTMHGGAGGQSSAGTGAHEEFDAAAGGENSSKDAGLTSGDTQVCVAYGAEAAQRCAQQGATFDAAFDECSHQIRALTPVGCGPLIREYFSCMSVTKTQCSDANACDKEQTDFKSCQSAFVARTGCTRLETQDGQRCGGQTPYAFACLRSPPSNCKGVSGAATIACCPDLSQ